MESMYGKLYNGTVVSVLTDKNQMLGECQVRVLELHGDSSKTADADLPVALFNAAMFPHSFGTFMVGDSVVVEFHLGDTRAPYVIGRATRLDKLMELVPEYQQNYGKVHGIYDPDTKAVIVFNSVDKTLTLRLADSSITLTHNRVLVRSPKVRVEADNAEIQADTVSVDCSSGSISAQGTLRLSASRIEEN